MLFTILVLVTVLIYFGDNLYDTYNNNVQGDKLYNTYIIIMFKDNTYDNLYNIREAPGRLQGDNLKL